MPNRLASAASPYLLQHKDNPVDWYPWGEEALARAKAEDKPIFLSVGYSACHWCHVMAHESFEDPAAAKVMNDLFINIKVDREERPDIDSIYMGAVVALTGNGGWPMSVFLTPDGVPFYGGTYFPPAPRGGMPAFTQVLLGVHDAWQHRRDQVVAGGRELLAHLHQTAGAEAGGAALPALADLADVIKSLWRIFDWRRFGWGQAPKFPQPMAIEFCLRYHILTGEATPLEMAVKTLRAMARGGMYDQLGGGFHRYSVDAHWLVPHFEKMLYDNAQLARVYLHGWQVTRDPEFRRVAEEVLDYVQREMTAGRGAEGGPAGGFYSATDADSEGEEGKFFVWTEAEIDAALGPDAGLFKSYYGVTAGGNFEGRNILYVPQDLEAVAAKLGLAPEAAAARLAAGRRQLLALRERRVRPGLDDKVLAGWNGLMLAAFAEAARVLDRADYRRTAEANAEFLLTTLRGPDGRLRRTWRAGAGPAGNGFLEDYTHVAEGLLALYETTFEGRYFTAARDLLDVVRARFADPAGGYFDTSDDHEALVVRPKDVQDNATPSGGAMAATGLLKLAAFTGEPAYRAEAEQALAAVGPYLARYPTGFAQWLNALAFALSRPQEVALVGDPAGADLQALAAEVFGPYRPFQVAALRRPGEPALIPLLEARDLLAGRAAAYVCENFTCRLPVTEPAELRAQLARPAAAA